MREKILLDGKWLFRLDRDNRGVKDEFFSRPMRGAEEVLIPHTYNVGSNTDEYRGAAWYQYFFEAPETWRGKIIRITFRGVYRDADIWLNGNKAGSHYGAGFTTFSLNITNETKIGDNLLTVRTDNQYSPYALPWFNQFDWADDGGIIRPVSIEAMEPEAIAYALIDAVPEIRQNTGRVDVSPADIRCRMVFADGEPRGGRIIRYELLDEERVLAEGELPEDGTIHVESVTLWHFDAPNLYTLRLITKGQAGDDLYEQKIGFRKFETDGKDFVLNGEKVRLVGTEWMPGSDPRIGNAERAEDIARFLQILKDTNCVYTRVHWQQDESFYEWCDAHGMMVQEEVPLWGMPKEPVDDTEEMVHSQFQEMISSHYNHPSIVSWGVGNELNGQSDVTRRYVTRAVAYFHNSDPHRPVSYVSNTAWESTNDANTNSDIQMCNEYIGTWQQGLDNEEAVRRFRRTNNEKPMLISEFGLCEPAFSGGDKRREQIFLDKVDIYRRGDVSGFIYFCLNNYRTQMGEDGEGRYRERIHGSTDLFGVPKPSYSTVRRECAPIALDGIVRDGSGLTVDLHVREDLPRYRTEGYYLMVSATGTAPVFAPIKDADPGEKIHLSLPAPRGRNQKLTIFRPTGDAVLDRDL